MSKKKSEVNNEIVVVSPEVKVTEIAADFKKFEKKSTAIVTILSEEDYSKANDFLIEVKGRINRVKALKEEYIKPLKDNIKKLEALFTEPQKNYEQIEAVVKRGMASFRLMIEEEAKKKEAQLKAQQAEDEKKALEAKKKGEPVPVPKPIVNTQVARPDSTVGNDAGKSTAKKVVKFEVLDADAIPKKYKDLVYAEAVKKGILEQVLRPVVKVEGMKCDIKGIRVFEDFDISVTA